MAALVRAQAGLQGDLLGFLESLPEEKLGGWVCTGWDSALKDTESKQRFTRLLREWGKSSNTILANFANAAIKGPQGRTPRSR